MNNQYNYNKPQPNNLENSQNNFQCPPQKLYNSMEINNPIGSQNNNPGPYPGQISYN